MVVEKGGWGKEGLISRSRMKNGWCIEGWSVDIDREIFILLILEILEIYIKQSFL